MVSKKHSACSAKTSWLAKACLAPMTPGREVQRKHNADIFQSVVVLNLRSQDPLSVSG
jgi:hypothetical protein